MCVNSGDGRFVFAKIGGRLRERSPYATHCAREEQQTQDRFAGEAQAGEKQAGEKQSEKQSETLPGEKQAQA